MQPKTKEEARLRIAHLLSRALKADVAAVTNRDPSAAKHGESLRAEVGRLRDLLPALPDGDGYAPPRYNERGELV